MSFVAVKEVLDVWKVDLNKGTLSVVFKSWDERVYVRTFRADKIDSNNHQWSYRMGSKNGKYIRGFVTGATAGSEKLLKAYYNQ